MAPLVAHKPGVDRAFERIYRRHALDVYRYAFAVLRNQADAEDATQTTFLNAYRALERGETPQVPHNWLIAIAHNVCRQRFRQASRRVQEVNFDDDVADQFVRPDDDDTPSPEDIRRALGHLGFNQRSALVMRELEGRSYAEIADLLGLSVSAVETLIFRARRALREQLEGSLTCGQAEQLISRQLDGELARAERSQLRAHIRECSDCRRFARSHRAHRSALKALGAVPLPSSLASLFGGGGATVGAAAATKAAAVVLAAGVASGIGWDVHRRLEPPKPAVRPSAGVVAPRQAEQLQAGQLQAPVSTVASSSSVPAAQAAAHAKRSVGATDARRTRRVPPAHTAAPVRRRPGVTAATPPGRSATPQGASGSAKRRQGTRKPKHVQPAHAHGRSGAGAAHGQTAHLRRRGTPAAHATPSPPADAPPAGGAEQPRGKQNGRRPGGPASATDVPAVTAPDLPSVLPDSTGGG